MNKIIVSFSLMIIVFFTSECFSSKIQGIVVKKSKAIPDIKIILLSIDKQLFSETYSDKNGEFSISSLPPGKYSIVAFNSRYREEKEVIIRKTDKIIYRKFEYNSPSLLALILTLDFDYWSKFIINVFFSIIAGYVIAIITARRMKKLKNKENDIIFQNIIKNPLGEALDSLNSFIDEQRENSSFYKYDDNWRNLEKESTNRIEIIYKIINNEYFELLFLQNISVNTKNILEVKELILEIKKVFIGLKWVFEKECNNFLKEKIESLKSILKLI